MDSLNTRMYEAVSNHHFISLDSKMDIIFLDYRQEWYQDNIFDLNNEDLNTIRLNPPTVLQVELLVPQG